MAAKRKQPDDVVATDPHSDTVARGDDEARVPEEPPLPQPSIISVSRPPTLHGIVGPEPSPALIPQGPIGRTPTSYPSRRPAQTSDANQMVDSYYLILAGRKRRTVARLVATADTEHPLATGFLVGPCLLLTCCHTLFSKDNAKHVTAQFDYLKVWDDMRESRRSDLHRLRPDLFFHNNKALDYALTFVEPMYEPTDGRSDRLLLKRKWNQLGMRPWDYESERYEQWVNIIQHPHGLHQKVALRDSQAVGLRQRSPKYLHYLADTNTRSSGSPVWNDKWELVGLHHRAIRNRGRDRARWGPWLANEGVKSDRIAESLLEEFERRDATGELDQDMKTLLYACFAFPEADPTAWSDQFNKLQETVEKVSAKKR